MSLNPITGEVDDWEPGEDPAKGILLPGTLAGLTEDDIAQAFPSPAHIEGALIESRTRIGRSINIIREKSRALKDAKRDLLLARGLARQEARASGEHRTDRDVTVAVELDDTVQAALAAVDEAALALEYARQLKSGLFLDVEILRSLNSNLRAEVRR